MLASETVDHNEVAVISQGFVRIKSNREWRVRAVKSGKEIGGRFIAKSSS
jgi:hypothetical protein